LQRAGLFLPVPVFSHGQLYVAFSRVGAFARLRVLALRPARGVHGRLTDAEATAAGVPLGTVCTRNVVYREVLR